MSQKNNRERNQLENKLNLDFLGRDEKFWQEKLERLAKSSVLSISDEKIQSSDGNETEKKHSEDTFNVRCKCNSCLQSRNLIVGIYAESKAYNDLWSKLRDIISSYYTLLSNEEEVAVVEQKYENLLKESYGIKWSSDGSIDVKKNIHASLGNMPSTNDSSSHQQIQTFIVVFNMLYTRDPHQLFELLCLQLTSIVLSYKEGVKELTKTVDSDGSEFYKPEEFINLILDGYETMTNVAKTLSPLVSEMSDHLEKFSLDWILMNQCMYYRFLYHDDIENQMAECILRLKDALDIEKYKSFVYRFLKFDEKMNRIGKAWETALVTLEKYRKSAPELLRSERISMVRKIFDKIHFFEMDTSECEIKSLMKSPLDWIVSSEDDTFWIGILHDIKQQESNLEMSKSASSNQNCKCWACLMAEGNSFRKEKCLNLEEPKLTETDDSETEIYHISWAVFKDLENHKSYGRSSLDPGIFCVFKHPSCTNIECHVAFNLLIGYFPLEFTKFLLKHYQPLNKDDREEILEESKHAFFQKHNEIDGKISNFDELCNADISDSLLTSSSFWMSEVTDEKDDKARSKIAAALAESSNGAIKFPPKNVIISYFHALFHIDNGDISMDPEWLEKINKGQLLKYDGSKAQCSHKSKQSYELDGIEMSLKELKLAAEISAEANEDNLEAVVQMSMKEVAQKLSTLSFADDDENTRNVLENEMKKPIVEALKLAASNKKLEAELKSLQKEHNMLKDMVKGLEQIHEEKKDILNDAVAKAHHQSHHSSTDSEISKGGDGAGCVCYYCSLFGKNQEISARSAETRDRLRKRLHHLQNQKEHAKVKNLKNIGLLLKNEKCNEKSDCVHNKPPPINKPPVRPVVQNTVKPEEVKLEPPAIIKKPVLVKKSPKIVLTKTEPTVKYDGIQRINSLVEFIEGPSSKAVEEIRRAEEIAVKKQMKKQKQIELKNRKQIDEHMQEVKKFNNILQDNAIELKQSQHRQTQLKSAKSRNQDPKRIKAAENRVDELKAKKDKIENEVKNIFLEISKLDPSVDITRECLELKNIMTVLHPNGPPRELQQIMEKPKLNQNSVSTQARKVEQVEKVSTPAPQSNLQPSTKKQQAHVVQRPTPSASSNSKSNEDDPAKRMVTIRRINLPHAEPQVTVTAKGTTADMDQLLYTFVNGQLVPATSLSKESFQNGSIQLFTTDRNGKKNRVEVENLPKASKSASPVNVEKNKELRREEKKRKKEEKKQTKLLELQKKDEEKRLQQEKILKLKEEKKKQEAKEEMKKRKTRKRLIDPEFAKNPFNILDDEGISSSDDETSNLSDNESDENGIDNVTEQRKQISKEQVKKPSISNTALKNGVSSKQNQQLQKKQSNDRKDSIASVASSASSSKETNKQSKKVQIHPHENNQPIHDFVPMKPTPAQGRAIPVQPVNSIMDQLSRGIRVEGLRLPPGITLTKVPPSEMLNSKRESINRITQPISEVAPLSHNHMVNQHVGNPGDLFMVESAPHAESVATNKKKNKKKKNKTDENQTNHTNTTERIVTLKNPMFYNNNSEPINSMMRNLQTPPYVQPMGEPQQSQASIVKNENGMYTIRNPTFHQSGFGPGNPNSSSSSFGPKQPSANDNYPFYDPQGDNPQSTKCNSVIGSEMKNMLQRKKEQEFASMDPYYQQHGMQHQNIQQPSSYQHFGNSNFDRNSMECENYDNGSYPIINLEDLRSGQMLNSEVSVHNVKESKIFQQNSLKRSPQNHTMFGDIMNSRPISNANLVPSAKPMNGNGDDWLHANKSSLHHILTEDYEKRQNSSNSNSPISVTSLEEIYDSDSKHQKLPSFYSNHHYHHHDDKSTSGASSLFSSGI